MTKRAPHTSTRALRAGAAALCLAALAALLSPAPAYAARIVVFSGGGWGHGIGLSQYGAYGRALNGAGAYQIVRHYYRGVGISRRTMPGALRVGLLQGRSAIDTRSWALATGSRTVAFKLSGSSDYLASGGPEVRWSVRPTASGGMKLFKNGVPVIHQGRAVFGSPTRPLVLVYERFGSIAQVINTAKRYAYGTLQFSTHPSSSCAPRYCVRLVASLPMQKYLYGLGEMPSSWPSEALKAQTLVARTYAYRRIQTSGQHRGVCNCALSDAPTDQVYAGDAKRDANGDGISDASWWRWKNAVDATNAQVVLYNGAPIQALYSSSSGGHTEHNENVWGGSPLPYLRGVSDPADYAGGRNPNYRWRKEIGWGALSDRLNRRYGTGTLKSFSVVAPRGVSGRVTVVKPGIGGGVKIVGTRRTVRVSGWSVRSALGLKDTLFSVRVVYR